MQDEMRKCKRRFRRSFDVHLFRMHHACALQSVHLVQLYLSCLDFNIEAKDCEGNTSLHYAAITGNCEIVELLMRSAEKLGVHLDQYVNREGLLSIVSFSSLSLACLGCSAAVLALKYGHIECANQITHRDADEFFVIPRPLSIYETPPTTDDNQTTTTTITTMIIPSKRKIKHPTNHHSPTKNETRPNTLSFGLLKIIFNDSDTGYSTRLAGLCKQEKQSRHRQHSKVKKHEALQTSTTTINKLDRAKSTIIDGTSNYSTEALVNETQLSHLTKERRASLDSSDQLNPSNRTSPRAKLLMQQHLFNQSNSKENANSSFIQNTTSKTQLSIEEFHSNRPNHPKVNTRRLNRNSSNSSLNHSENDTSITTVRKLARPKTAIGRNHGYINPPPSRLSSPRIKPINPPSSDTRKRTMMNDRPLISSTNGSKSSEYSHSTRPISAVASRSIPRANDASCSIREAKGTASRFNKPEELFGLRPEELFASDQYQPKILDTRTSTRPSENTRSKRTQFQKQQHIWQQDVDKIIELYNIHHSANYRKSAIPPPVTQPVVPADPLNESSHSGRVRRSSITKPSTSSSKSTSNSKQTTYAVVNIPRQNSVTRSTIKLTNT